MGSGREAGLCTPALARAVAAMGREIVVEPPADWAGRAACADLVGRLEGLGVWARIERRPEGIGPRMRLSAAGQNAPQCCSLSQGWIVRTRKRCLGGLRPHPKGEWMGVALLDGAAGLVSGVVAQEVAGDDVALDEVEFAEDRALEFGLAGFEGAEASVETGHALVETLLKGVDAISEAVMVS